MYGINGLEGMGGMEERLMTEEELEGTDASLNYK